MPHSAEDIESRVEALYQLAAQAFGQNRFRDAIASASQAIACNAKLENIHFLMGSAHMELGEYGDAARAFSACLSLGPQYPLIEYAQLYAAIAKVRGNVGQSQHLRLTPHIAPSHCLVSIIICSNRPERYARVCEHYHALMQGVAHEIVGIHDATSLSEGYNRGIKKAAGDFIVFSHDDVEIVTPDFAAKLLSYLDRYDVIGIAGTTRLAGPTWVNSGWPHIHGQVGFNNTASGKLVVQSYGQRGTCTPHAQALDGVLLAAKRAVTQRIAFDQESFDGWHLYDMDFTFSAYRAGFSLAVCHDICLIHDSSGDWGAQWQRYATAFMDKHAGALPADATSKDVELCVVEVASRAEWLLMTQAMGEVSGDAAYLGLRPSKTY